MRARSKRILGGAIALIGGLFALGFRRDVPVDELRVKYAPPPSQFVDIEGMPVHFRDEGPRDAPPLLLIHGSSSSLHTWDGWTAALAGKRRIVRLDLPGFGLTGPAPEPDPDYHASRLARVARKLLDHLRIERADIAGNSLGGWVALKLALEHGDHVGKIILIDAAGLSGHKAPVIFRIARVPLLSSILRWETPEAVVRKNVLEVYGEPSRVTDDLVARYYALTLREGNRGAFVARMQAVDPPLDALLPSVKNPILIEWGERDVWIPLAFARRFQEALAGAQLVTFPTAGHVPMEEKPAETAAVAEAFLSASPPK